MKRLRGVCLAAVFAFALAFAPGVRAQAQTIIGGELHEEQTGTEVVPNNRVGLSVWYRFDPRLAFGLTAEALGDIGFGEAASATRRTLRRGDFLEGFVDARLFPSSFAGAFGRASAGLAVVDLSAPSLDGYSGPGDKTGYTEPMFELEVGPELRLFRTVDGSVARPTWFLRARGTFTALPSNAFVGWGFALGCEG